MAPPAPTTAERIRSTCVRAGGAMLAIEGVEPTASAVHHLLDDGSFAITVPIDGSEGSAGAWWSPPGPGASRPFWR